MHFISNLRTNFALVLLFKILNWKLFSSDLKPSVIFYFSFEFRNLATTSTRVTYKYIRVTYEYIRVTYE